MTLRLVHKSKVSPHDEWGRDQYGATDSDCYVGRIFRENQTGESWFWGIDSSLMSSRSLYGRELTRDEAMTAFRTAWDGLRKDEP